MTLTEEALATALEAQNRLWVRDRLAGLICLVGASPLPNAIAVLALAPQRVRLVYTPQTKSGAEKLVEVVREVPKAAGITFVPDGSEPGIRLPDANDPTAIEEKVSSLAKGWALFYTGGTKPMAVHAYQAWRAQGGRVEHACQLSDATGRLSFDDGGCSISVQALPSVGDLTIDRLGRLHDLEATSRHAPVAQEPTKDDAHRILDAVLADPVRARGDLAALHGGPPDLGGLAGKAREKAEKAWHRFLNKNGWLEIALAALVDEASAEIADRVPGTREPCTPVFGKIGSKKRDFQVDVVHRIGARLFAFSCTTGRDWEDATEDPPAAEKAEKANGRGSPEKRERDHTKLKMFEVEVRSRQIGGDLARSAVVCLAGSANCENLRDQVHERWVGDDHPPQVFGIEDLRQWRCAGDLRSLKEFLSR